MAVRILKLILSSLIFCLPLAAKALPVVVDFETFTDGDVLTHPLTGLTLTNALVQSAGLSLNEVDFPPLSGTSVIIDNGGPITIDFTSLLASVGGYFTYAAPLTLNAYRGVNLIGTLTSAFSANFVTGADIGSTPNEFLSFTATGITRLVVSGDPGGGSFTLDDLTYTLAAPTSMPEPGTVTLGLSALLWAGRGWRDSKSRLGK